MPPHPSQKPDTFPRGRAVRVDGVLAGERKFDSVGECGPLVFPAGHFVVGQLELRNLNDDTYHAYQGDG